MTTSSTMSDEFDEADIDAADIEVTEPPAGWRPDITDEDPDPRDVRDLDEDADA